MRFCPFLMRKVVTPTTCPLAPSRGPPLDPGLIGAVVLVIASKTVWVAVFKFPTALFPYDNPALFSMPLAFLAIWLGSLSDRTARATAERRAFDAQFVQSETGIRSLDTNDALAGAA